MLVRGTKPVTHILLAQSTHTGADVVTRRSVLGSSGRVGYLGGANAAWVLVDAHGSVVAGGAIDGASHMTHDIGTGESRKNPVQPVPGEWVSKDPLERNESWIRLGVLILALAIALIGVAATLSVVLQD